MVHFIILTVIVTVIVFVLFYFPLFSNMKKRKVLSSSISQDFETQNTHGSEIIDAEIDSNVMPKPKHTSKGKKDLSTLADISHKNTTGANNWQTFLKLDQHKTKDSSKPNLKNTNRPYQLNELTSANPVVLPIERSLKRKIGNHNLTRYDGNDKPVGDDSEVKFMPNVKSWEINTQTNRHVLTKQIAMDCEMVGVEVGVNNSILARISLVNAHGDCIYDKYVKPTEPILDYRTRVSGIRPKDLEHASDFKTVQKEVADILNGRVLVGHALKNDLRVLFLSHPRHAIRDTSKFKRFRVGPTPSLKSLAKKYLGVTIQDGEHSSVQDALAAMQLYKMFKKEWEASVHQKKFTNQKTKKMFGSSVLTSTMDA